MSISALSCLVFLLVVPVSAEFNFSVGNSTFNGSDSTADTEMISSEFEPTTLNITGIRPVLSSNESNETNATMAGVAASNESTVAMPTEMIDEMEAEMAGVVSNDEPVPIELIDVEGSINDDMVAPTEPASEIEAAGFLLDNLWGSPRSIVEDSLSNSNETMETDSNSDWSRNDSNVSSTTTLLDFDLSYNSGSVDYTDGMEQSSSDEKFHIKTPQEIVDWMYEQKHKIPSPEESLEYMKGLADKIPTPQDIKEWFGEQVDEVPTPEEMKNWAAEKIEEAEERSTRAKHWLKQLIEKWKAEQQSSEDEA